jgi:hypothetical protein
VLTAHFAVNVLTMPMRAAHNALVFQSTFFRKGATMPRTAKNNQEQ